MLRVPGLTNLDALLSQLARMGHVMQCQVTDTRLPRVLRRTRAFHN